MRWKFLHSLLLFALVFFAVDLFFVALELYGVHFFFTYSVHENGRVYVHVSDIVVFFIALPIAIFLDILWRKERWSWFSETAKLHRNIFYVFLLLYLVLMLAVLFGGYQACRAACETVQHCSVSYSPFEVEVLYLCKPLITSAPAP